MSSKAGGATVALHGQVDKRTASEQLSLLVADLCASADGAWAALALHERVELFSLNSGNQHGHLPVFEVCHRPLLVCMLSSAILAWHLDAESYAVRVLLSDDIGHLSGACCLIK